MEMDEDLLDKLLDRLDESAAKRGAAEVQIGHLAQFRDENYRAMSAKDKDIGELKRMRDDAVEERDDAVNALKALYDAVKHLRHKNHRRRIGSPAEMHSIQVSIDAAGKVLEGEIPF